MAPKETKSAALTRRAAPLRAKSLVLWDYVVLDGFVGKHDVRQGFTLSTRLCTVSSLESNKKVFQLRLHCGNALPPLLLLL